MKFCTLAGDIRSGRPLSKSQPNSMIRSTQRLAACRSDRSSASSEDRNPAASRARRSAGQGGFRCRGARSAAAGGSVRMRDRMNACRAAKASLTGGSSASSVAVSAVWSSLRAWPASICRKASSGFPPRTAARREHSAISLSTWELTQPSLIMPLAL